MAVASEDYHVNAQAQSVPRQSVVPAGIFYLACDNLMVFIVGKAGEV
jgi:hypothetical protein